MDKHLVSSLGAATLGPTTSSITTLGIAIKKHDAQIPVSLMLVVAFFTGTQSVVRLAVVLPSVVAPIYDGLEN